MSKLFFTVLKMSLTASYVILFVIIVRLMLKKAPKVISYALWCVVAFRLVVPFSFESVLSLLPRNAKTVSILPDIIYRQGPQVGSGIVAVDSTAGNSLPAPAAVEATNPFQTYVGIGAYIWILGSIALFVYSLVSVLLLKRRLKDAQLIERNIYQVNNLKTPFVLGMINPRIYLPVGLSEEEQNYILMHEQTHIQRKDHIIKILAFLIASIHWFNPLVWVAFMLMSTDMELSCDEKVLQAVDEGMKKPYANSLLSLASGRHVLSVSPLAFGEGNVQVRIKKVLNYKKPKFWAMLFSIVIVAVIGIGLAANPKLSASIGGSSYRVKEILYQAPMYSYSYGVEAAPRYRISSGYDLYSKEVNDDYWTLQGRLRRSEISRKELSALFHLSSDSVYEAINKTKLIYRADTDDKREIFYLVMQPENGDILLALGYDLEESRHIRWLFKLEKTDDVSDAADAVFDTISTGIRWAAAADVSPPVRDFAVDYVHKQIEFYNGLGYNIKDAKITAMTRINTGTAALTKDIQMWLLEYRLLPEDPDKVILTGGMQLEDGWITEWDSAGQPLLVAACDWDSETEIWRRVGATDTLWVQEEYQGDYTAATMAMFSDYLLRTGIAWGYAPSRSSVFPALPVRIDMPFSNVHVSVDRGRLWLNDETKKPNYIDCGKETDYPAGKFILWSPSEGDAFDFGDVAVGCILHFEIMSEDEGVHKGTILVEQIKQTEKGVWFYGATLAQTDTGLILVNYGEYGGCILKLP